MVLLSPVFSILVVQSTLGSYHIRNLVAILPQNKKHLLALNKTLLHIRQAFNSKWVGVLFSIFASLCSSLCMWCYFHNILRFRPLKHMCFGSFLNAGKIKYMSVSVNLREYYREPYPFWCEWPFDPRFMQWVAWTSMPFSDNTLVLFSYYASINLWNSCSKDEWLCSFCWEINRRFANHNQRKHRQPTYQLSNVFTKIVCSWVIWVQFIFKGHHSRQFQMAFYGH